MKIPPVTLSTSNSSSCSPASSNTPPNPYARDSSRRAIACVTCAKAKTRCDKALPSCSRCIAKGIKCDPRSTRRTSDNNYRMLPTKKPFAPSKRFPTPGVLPSSTNFPSPRSIMRAPSHIDFRTAVKMSQKAAITSGMPKMTPPPTYQSQIVDECYLYNSTPGLDLRFTPEIEQDGYIFSRGATPQTPVEPFNYNDPVPVVAGLDYSDCQLWSRDESVTVGLGFVDTGSWTTPMPELEETPQANLFPHNVDFSTLAQMQGTFDTCSGTISKGWLSFPQDNANSATKPDPPRSLIDGSLDSGIVMQGEWNQPQSQDAYIDMSNMFTSAPYVPKMQATSSNVPMWEDVFMPGSIPY